jgi:Xaa-Pro aminopeptidase
MRQANLDAILGFPNQSHWDQFQADVRYLTHIGGNQTEAAVVFEAGDMIDTELEAKYGGYIAQTVQAACLGKIPPELKRAFDVSVEVFDALVDFMKPGVSFREVVAFYQRLVREAGATPKGMPLHGREIGEDRPQITGESDGDVYNTPTYTMHLDLPLVEGNVFVLKPGAMPSHAPDSIRCGDMVVITRDGARRLGKRQFTFPELL